MVSSSSRRSPAGLRALLQGPDLVTVPGVSSPLGAIIAERVGFQAVYMSGYGTAATLFGLPDVGLVSVAEMAENLRRITDRVAIPVLADADTGGGDAVNVKRTVELYEAAGAQAIQIEDQAWPKRCGHMEGKRVVPTTDMERKVAAAVLARRSADTLIIARTDALAVEGVADAVERARRYVAAGADIIFVEAPESHEHLRHIGQALAVPLLVNMSESGKTPLLSDQELAALGYRLALWPSSELNLAVPAMHRALRCLKAEGSTRSVAGEMIPMSELHDLLRLPDLDAFERRVERMQQGLEDAYERQAD